jgi:hypothetical protein
MATPNFYPDRDINNQICYPIAISFPIGKYRTIIEREQTKSIPIGKKETSASPPSARCRHPHCDVGPPGLKKEGTRNSEWCEIEPKPRQPPLSHGRDARAPMWVW